MARIFVTRRLPQPALDRLAALADCWVSPYDRDLTPEELRTLCPGAEVLTATLADRIDAGLLDARPEARLVANYAVGYNNVDVEAARARGVTVTNTPGVLTEATADLTMALILDAARRVTESDRLVRRGGFQGLNPAFLLGTDLAGKTLGVYGLGRIGEAAARRALVFGLKIIYHNRRPNPEAEARLGARYVSFENLLAESDFLTINAPLAPETRHRFTLAEFRAMKPTSFLINVGRGPIVKEADLAEALERRIIAGAALDVYEFEPKVEPRLLTLENVALCPHLGSATVETRTRMGMVVAENVEAFLQGRVPPNKVV